MEGKQMISRSWLAAAGRLEREAGAARLLRVCCALLLAVAAAIAVVAVSARSADSQESGQVVPLERAHAHNDYEHERPLYDALGHGFKSVEADIWLIDGELVVSHDDPRRSTTAPPEGTLESLYLEPLRREIKANGGSVYSGDPDYFTLLIDIKSEDVATYRALHEELESYADVFTKFGPRGVRDRAVTAIVSGNRPRAYMETQRVRYAAYDGRIPEDLGGSQNPQSFAPLVSQNWTRLFTWQGVGPCQKLSAKSCTKSWQRPMPMASGCGSGRRRRSRRLAKPCGGSFWPPRWTTSTRTTWPRWRRFCRL